MYNVNATDKLFISYRDSQSATSEYELAVTYEADNSAKYTLFTYKTGFEDVMIENLFKGTSSSETVYDVLVFSKDANDVIIYEDDIIPNVTLVASL